MVVEEDMVVEDTVVVVDTVDGITEEEEEGMEAGTS